MTAWLLGWLWQGMVLAMAISAALAFLPRVNASTRYLLWWGAFAVLLWLGFSSLPVPAVVSDISTANSVPAAPALFELSPLPQWLLTSIALVWFSVALFKLAKVLPGVRALYRLKDSCEPAGEALASQLPLWREATRRGRAAQLMICDDLPNAAVLGLRQPCVAFPSRLLEMVSAGELDQILLHEYGHVQRRDDWARLGQALIEAVLWAHPAARWIGRELNLEREVACDDWVVSKTRAARAYAGCLARVAERHRLPAVPSMVPGLFGRTPDVLRRVDRLLDVKRNATRKLSMVTASIAICAMTVAATHLRALPLFSEVRVAYAMQEIPLVASTRALSIARGPDAPVPAAQILRMPVVHKPRVARPAANENEDVVSAVVTAPSVTDTGGSLIPSRSFAAAVVQEDQQARKISDAWQFGATIGKATRRASVAVADSATRAGISIAKSF